MLLQKKYLMTYLKRYPRHGKEWIQNFRILFLKSLKRSRVPSNDLRLRVSDLRYMKLVVSPILWHLKKAVCKLVHEAGHFGGEDMRERELSTITISTWIGTISMSVRNAQEIVSVRGRWGYCFSNKFTKKAFISGKTYRGFWPEMRISVSWVLWYAGWILWITFEDRAIWDKGAYS